MVKKINHITIRKAKPSDTESLAQLFLEARCSTFYWQDTTLFQLQDFEQQTIGEVIFVAENAEQKILGFISVWEKDRPVFIHHLFIASAHQREGIGTLLVHSLFSWLPFPYRLKCLERNQNTLAFYRKTGWIEIDQGLTKEGKYLLMELDSQH